MSRRLGSWLIGLFAVCGFSAQAYVHTPLVTGNGFGYAVVDAENGQLIRYYAHPYKFSKPSPQPGEDGELTSNLIDKAEWQNPSARPHIHYLRQSQVIRVFHGSKQNDFFMPFTFERNALLTTANTSGQCFHVSWQNPVTDRQALHLSGAHVEYLNFKDVNESLLVIPLDRHLVKAATDTYCGSGFAFVVVNDPGEMSQALSDFQNWRRGESGDALRRREINALEIWRVSPPATLSARALQVWRQSETVLRMAQIRERNHRAYGLILASLPIGSWFIPWVRDMAYSELALIEMGHQAEARAALNALYNAGPIGTMQSSVHGVPYQISLTRYFGDGSEEADYSGAQNRNLEFDDWGFALWETAAYVHHYGDRPWLRAPAAHGSVFETAFDYIVKPIVANLEPYGAGLILNKDTSCWEQNWIPLQHYAFSNIMVLGGLKRFLSLAKSAGTPAQIATVEDTILKMQDGFKSAFVHGDEVYGTLEDTPRNQMDGALLEGINMGTFTDPAWTKTTLNRMDVLKTVPGGYRRTLGDSEYEAHEFLFINFLLARAQWRLGHHALADSIVARMEQKAHEDNDLFPEMYVSRPNSEYPGEIGAPAGSMPMVGYGSGSYILYIMETQGGRIDRGLASH